MIKPFVKVQSDELTLNLIQDRVADILTPLTKLEMLDSILLQRVAIVNGTTAINHGLGHPVIGWMVVRKNANVQIWDVQDTNAIPSKTLLLSSTGAATISLVVF